MSDSEFIYMGKNKYLISFANSGPPPRTRAPSAVEEVINFFAAAERKDYKTIQEYIQNSKINPNCRHITYESPLHMAAQCGDTTLAKILLTAEGININIKTVHDLYTPLHVAIIYESIKVIELLLKYGADVDAVDKNCNSSLHKAVCIGNYEITKILLDYNANPNMHNDFSNTPLSIAVLDERDYKLTKILIQGGADVKYEPPESIPLFYETILNCYEASGLRLLRLLWLNGVDPNLIDRFGRNAMHYGALSGLSTIVEFLHSIDCREDIKDCTNRTPLNIAVAHGFIEVVALLRNYRDERAKHDIASRHISY